MSRSKSVIAVGVVLCLLLSALTPFILPGTARAQPADSPWPMFGQNLQRTGQSTYTGPQVPYLRWSFSTGGWVSFPSIGTDGTIYVGCNDRNLYAMNPDGTEKWRFSTGALIPTFTSISADGTIYVGSRNNHVSGIPNANLYAINPDGTEKWRFATGDRSVSSPAIAMDGTIFVASHDKNLYALNPDGTEKWRFNTGDLVPTLAAIAADGTIYIGAGDWRVAPRSNANLYAINPDGTEKWSFRTGYVGCSSPAIGTDGTIYVSSGSSLYAINPDGTEKWRFATGDRSVSSPAIAMDGTIFVGSWDRNLYALNPDGTQKWSFTTGDDIRSSPAIGADGTIYVGSYDGNLYAINPDGSEKWRFATGERVYSSPSIGADHNLYFHCLDERLYAIAEAPEGYVLVHLATPSAGATNVGRTSINFTWNALGEVESFDFALSSNADLADPVEIKEGLTTTAYTSVATLDYETTYYWQVIAWRNGDNVGQSNIGTFTTVAEPLPPPDVGVKAGDYIKVDYEITGWPADQPRPEWLKLEFLTVDDTSVTVIATMRMSDGTEETDTVPVEVGGGAEASGLSGFIIPANSEVGDSIVMGGFEITFADSLLEGETTGTYAGADRTVVYAGVSMYGVALTYYWDKQTGVLVESTTVYSGITMTATATETNMWEGASIPVPNGGPTPVPWWLWVIMAVVVVAAAAAIYRKRRKVGPGASN